MNGKIKITAIKEKKQKQSQAKCNKVYNLPAKNTDPKWKKKKNRNSYERKAPTRTQNTSIPIDDIQKK